MKKKLVELSQRQFTRGQRLLLLLILGILFVIVLPATIVLLGDVMDGWIGLPNGTPGWFQVLIGVLMALGGFAFGIWSVYALFVRGRGTPLPWIATQRLVITPPYSYCRNPMALGTIVAYLGIVIMAGSWSALILVILLAAALILYIRDNEEEAMVSRFGKDYEIYRRSTPFIIPRFLRRS